MPTLRVNGSEVALPDAQDDTTLLDLLRDGLGLTGAKYGCGVGLCGACTVHVDGRAARACTLRAADLAGRDVLTIEGLAATSGAALHPVQEAWLAEGVPQCGYCQAGQIMAAAALLAETPDPDDARIRSVMNGNLCRCGTYLRVRRAIRRAAAQRGATS